MTRRLARPASWLQGGLQGGLQRAASSPLALRTAGNLGFRLAGTGLSFLSAIVLARLLGQADYGAYVHWMAITGLATACAGLGMPQLVVQEIAAARGRGRTRAGRIRGVALTGLAVTLLAAALAVAGGALLAWSAPAGPGLAGILLAPPLLASLVLALGLAAGLLAAVQLGFEHVLLSQVGSAVLQPGLLVAVAAGCWLLGSGSPGVSGALLLQLGTGLVALLATLALLAVRLEPMAAQALRRGPILWRPRAWLTAGFFLMTNQLLVNAQTQLDVLLLGWLAGPGEVAVYHAASRGAYMLTFLFGALATAMAPTVARLHAGGRRAELQATLARSAGSIFALTLPLALALAALGPWYLGLFGDGFARGYPAFLALIMGWLFCVAAGPGQIVLLMCGHPKVAAGILASGLAANAALDLALIPPFGATGAAAASASSLALVALAWGAAAARLTGCRVDVLAGLPPAARAWSLALVPGVRP